MLLDRLDDALDGRSQVVLVKGEAGSGKTAVLTELARRAERADPRLVVVAGQCQPSTGAVDLYAPFRQVLGLLSGR